MMLICGEEHPSVEPSKEEIDQTMAEIEAWTQKWADKIVDGGAELQPSATAKTVRADRDGRPLITDGPYAELKEVIGGVIYLECADIDEAAAVAAEWPRIRPNSWMTAVEIRPVMQR